MQWIKLGLKNIWLPYTQMKFPPSPLLSVVAAEGCKIILEDGRKLIDGISSWWSVCHGYSHPYIVKEMVSQVKNLAHIMMAGCAHQQSYQLANRLANMLPEDLNKVFFSDSGSVAVEVAMKMAVQYYYNLGESQRTKFISFNNSYHGDTSGCMSISSSCIQGNTFKNFIKPQYSVPISEDLDELKKLLKSHNKEIAGVIIEPILQGAGGMKLHSAQTLKKIYEITKEHNTLFIADEIATGFYRLGKRFACNFADITPDIITLGKALTGGMCSLGATVATEKIFNTFLSDKLEKAFMHGPTFMGNPIACAATNASLDIFENENYEAKIRLIEQQLQKELTECKEYKSIKEVRIKGAMAALEIKNSNWQQMFTWRKKGVELGVWIRPFANVVYLMPPFVINKNELTQLTLAIKKLIKS